MEKLKKCPFCGGADISSDWWEVTCRCGGYLSNKTATAWTKDQAIKAWNDRPYEPIPCRDCRLAPMGGWCLECKHYQE